MYQCAIGYPAGLSTSAQNQDLAESEKELLELEFSRVNFNRLVYEVLRLRTTIISQQEEQKVVLKDIIRYQQQALDAKEKLRQRIDQDELKVSYLKVAK